MANTGHNIVQSDPKALVALLVGFFRGRIKGRYEEKPLSMFISP